jgi:hypothetical protein
MERDKPMRNILEYPITDADRLDVFKRLLARYIKEVSSGDGPIGGLDGVVLREIIELLEEKNG